MGYKTTIGLEIHAELKTQTKMFCGCKNDPLEKTPNKNVCPICLAHPGTLPTINKKAIELTTAVGYALGGKILNQSHFDRKSYFYPDLPKGYQISQYEEPFVMGGKLVDVDITRIHLEEDTAGIKHGKDGSLMDFNRAGLPLMELVTEPVIENAEKALEFAKELQLILRYLNASDANMERGQMRVEANVSISPEGSEKLGTKVELKNINSFKAVANAIAYEIERQREVLDSGKKVVQETRGWNDKKSKTFSQRIKEEADDYRYMPEPDLPPIHFVGGRASPTHMGGPPVDFSAKEGIDLEAVRISVPELPEEKRKRFSKEYSYLPKTQINHLVYNYDWADKYEEIISEMNEIKDPKVEKMPDAKETVPVHQLTSNIAGILNEKNMELSEMKASSRDLAEYMVLVVGESISTTVARRMLPEIVEKGTDPHTIINRDNLGQISDEKEIVKVVKEIIAANKKAVDDYKKGKETAVKFLIGAAMARLRGRGNPELLEKLFREHLSK